MILKKNKDTLFIDSGEIKAATLKVGIASIDYLYCQTLSTPKWLNTQLGNNADPLIRCALPNLPRGNIT